MAELTPEEGTTEVIEEFIKTTRLIEAKYAWLGGVIVSATSALVGYVAAERKYRRKYEALAENEISEMREHFARKELAREEKGDLTALVEEKGYTVPPATEIAERMADRVVGPPPPSPVDPMAYENVEAAKANEAAARNVFADHPVVTHEWDYEQEAAARKNGKPYVIHYDELGESGYESATTFTYYAGDDVLCDERDSIVDDRNALIGDENLDRFGHGSNDPVIVYIRNDDIAAEFEVIKSDKTYAEEVAGFKHADDDYPRRRRPKFDDE